MEDLPRRLRDALQTADYTYGAVVGLVGEQAHAALSRNETTPALRRTSGGSALATLVRLFVLQTSVTSDTADKALPGLVGALAHEGLLAADGGAVRALLDCRPYADDDRDLWVVSDLTPGLDGGSSRVGRDHVLGISAASTSLAQLTLREPVGRSLDLGTGCGVQALHLAAHSRRVVATDVNARALRIARFNAALNGLEDMDVRGGSLFDPVAGERFDLIATNPPFVIGPATGEQLVYRDSGLPGDQVVERVVRGSAAHLAPGGWLQLLGNWAIVHDRTWQERITEWLPEDHAALVVQREVLDPSAYVELWLKDAGLHGAADYVERYDAWLSWFEEQRIEGVGFGWLNLRAAPGEQQLLDWPYAVEQPMAPAIGSWGRTSELLADLPDDQLLAARPVMAPDVRQETDGLPGAEDPESIVLRQQRGLRRARVADTATAALVGAADGALAAGSLLEAIATLLERDTGEVRDEQLPVLRELLAEGFLTL